MSFSDPSIALLSRFFGSLSPSQAEANSLQNMIRIGLYGALTGDKEQVGHAQHCIEYLRQNIICAADTTLEPIKPEDNGVDGFGNKHNCRNYSAVKEWAELYRGTDTAGQHGARGGMLE